MESLRCYTFNNYYLSSIQQGIQTAHSQTSLMLKVFETRDINEMNAMSSWAREPVTICLNGGNNKSLKDLETSLQTSPEFPWCSFHEDDDSLGGILTSIAVILSKDIYEDMVDFYKSRTSEYYDKEEDVFVVSNGDKCKWMSVPLYAVVQKISTCGLAK